MKILAIDCADKPVSCAVVGDSDLLGERYLDSGLTHSQTLMPMVSELLSDLKMSTKDIDMFAVTCGPGSFTGLRIGIAAVKGLAFPESKPCVGVSTLHTIARGAANEDGIICPVMDARCNQVYNALFECRNGQLTRLCEDRAITISQLEEELSGLDSQPIIIAGKAAKSVMDRLGTRIPNAVAATEYDRCQRAIFAALIAGEYAPVCAEDLLPVYLRLPQAERELKLRQKS